MMRDMKFKVSVAGQALIDNARRKKEWKISTTDLRPAIVASKCAMRAYASANEWLETDTRWLKELYSLFDCDILASGKDDLECQKEALKIDLANDDSASLGAKIEEKIEAGIIHWKGVSSTQWKRFASRSQNKYRFKETVFKAFCKALDLDWQTVAAEIQNRPYA